MERSVSSITPFANLYILIGVNLYADQRALGFSMRVERAAVDDVKDRLAALKRKASGVGQVVRAPAYDEYKQKLETVEAEKEANKKRKKDAEQELKASKLKADEDIENEQDGSDIAAMMGFGGFGTSKKK